MRAFVTMIVTVVAPSEALGSGVFGLSFVGMAAAGHIEDAKTMLSVFWLDRLVSQGDVIL